MTGSQACAYGRAPRLRPTQSRFLVSWTCREPVCGRLRVLLSLARDHWPGKNQHNPTPSQLQEGNKVYSCLYYLLSELLIRKLDRQLVVNRLTHRTVQM